MEVAKVIQHDGGRGGGKRQDFFHHFRFIVISLGGLAVGIIMLMRYSVAVAMVGMINQTQLYIDAHQNASSNDIYEHTEMGRPRTGEFNWNHEQQEKIISFYMISYVSLQYYSTKTITRLGLRVGVCASIALSALFNALTPVVSYWGWQWAVLSRLAQGAAASCIMPTMVTLIERWSTQEGASNGVSLFQFISHVLTVAVPSIGGALASIDWKWSFYVPQFSVFLFCILWYILITDEPESSTIISKRELYELKRDSSGSESREHSNRDNVGVGANLEKPSISLLSILKIKEFHGLWITWVLWGSTAVPFPMVLPAYMSCVFDVPVSQVGALASTAQLASMFGMLWPDHAIAAMMKTFGLDLTSSRKILAAFCLVTENLSMFGIIYLQAHQILLLNVARFFHTAFYTISIATIMSQFKPHRLSGIIFSIVNSSACAAGTFVCVLVGKFLDYEGDTPETWSWIFMAAIVLNSMYLLTYSLFCHSNPANLKSIRPDCIEEANK